MPCRPRNLDSGNLRCHTHLARWQNTIIFRGRCCPDMVDNNHNLQVRKRSLRKFVQNKKLTPPHSRNIRTVPLTTCKCLAGQEGLVRLEKLRAIGHRANENDNSQSHSSQDLRNLIKEAEAIHIASQLEEMVRRISSDVEIDGNAGLEIQSIVSKISSRLNNTIDPISIDEIHAGLWTSLR